MESKISNILEYADRLSAIENQKDILLRQFEENSILYWNGHQVTANSILIAEVKSYLDMGRTQNITLLDDFKTPFAVADTEKFSITLSTKYQEALQTYHAEYNKLMSSKGDLDA
jgi:hypothetical protein|tara:strand:+ start:3252 stop:3593 length:342 start_codon:yes stop_codon:yes gene_type:complete